MLIRSVCFYLEGGLWEVCSFFRRESGCELSCFWRRLVLGGGISKRR